VYAAKENVRQTRVQDKRTVISTTHEDDDFVDTIDEFWREVLLDGTHHQVPGGFLDGAVAHVVQVRRTQVRRHHDDRVPEIHDATLAIGEATIVQHLQEKRHEFTRSLFDLVDEHDTVGLPADVFGKLATRVVPDVARGRSNEPRDGMLLGVFRAVDANHSVWRVEQDGCKLGKDMRTRFCTCADRLHSPSY
jgi:hypothetical protein